MYVSFSYFLYLFLHNGRVEVLFDPRIHVLPLRESGGFLHVFWYVLRFHVTKRLNSQFLFLLVALLLRLPFLLDPLALFLRDLK